MYPRLILHSLFALFIAVYRGRNHINIKPTTCSPTKNILPMVQASTSSRRIVMNEISVMGSEADKTVFNRRK